MYLGWIDYGVLIVLLSKFTNKKSFLTRTFAVVFGAIGIYQGCIRSKQTSVKEFLVGDGRMKVIYFSYNTFKINVDDRFYQQH
jgi:uncharacterized membrane protein